MRTIAILHTALFFVSVLSALPALAENSIKNEAVESVTFYPLSTKSFLSNKCGEAKPFTLGFNKTSKGINVLGKDGVSFNFSRTKNSSSIVDANVFKSGNYSFTIVSPNANTSEDLAEIRLVETKKDNDKKTACVWEYTSSPNSDIAS